MKSLEKILKLLIDSAIISIGFFLPLCFSLFFITNDVFELNKSVLFDILVLALLMFTVLKFLFLGNWTAARALVRPRFFIKYLLIPIIFFAMFGLSVYLSTNRSESFNGLYDRQQGLVTHIYLFLFYLLLIINLPFPSRKHREESRVEWHEPGFLIEKTNPQLNTDLPWIPDRPSAFGNDKKNGILYAIAASAFFISLYGLIQAAGHDFLPWTESTQIRATSTFGQPNGLGSFLLFSLPVSVFLLLRAKKLIWRILIGTAAIMEILALVFTYSISSWLGVIAALFLTGITWSYFRWRDKKSPFACPPKLKHGREGGMGHESGGNLASSSTSAIAGTRHDNKSPFEGGDEYESGRNMASATTTTTASARQGDVSKRFKYFKYITLAVILLSMFFYIACNYYNPGVLRLKISNIFDLRAGSTASRVLFWQAAWQAIKEKPFFGYGPETQGNVLVKYYKPEWAVYEDVNVMPNRAHNLILDLLLTQGIIGLAVFLAFLVWLLKLIIGNIKSDRERLLNYTFLFALTGYLIYLEFSFHHLTTLVYFWLFAALAVIIHGNFLVPAESPALDSAEGEKSPLEGGEGRNNCNEAVRHYAVVAARAHQGDVSDKSSLTDIFSFTFFAKLFLTVAVGAGVFMLANRELNRLIADHYFFRLREANSRHELFTSFELYDYLKEKAPRFSFYDGQFAFMLSDWLAYLGDARFSETVKERLAAIYPKIIANGYSGTYVKAVTAAALADKDHEPYYREAEDYFRSVIDLSPGMPINYRELGIMYNKKGDYDSAILALNAALSKLPNLDNPYLNARHKAGIEREMFLSYFRLGDAYAGLENYAEAKKYYELALSKNTNDTSLYSKLAGISEKAGDYEKAIWYINKGKDYAPPEDYYWPYALALLYEKQKNMDMAKKYASDALELAPDNKFVQDLLGRVSL